MNMQINNPKYFTRTMNKIQRTVLFHTFFVTSNMLKSCIVYKAVVWVLTSIFCIELQYDKM